MSEKLQILYWKTSKHLWFHLKRNVICNGSTNRGFLPQLISGPVANLANSVLQRVAKLVFLNVARPQCNTRRSECFGKKIMLLPTCSAFVQMKCTAVLRCIHFEHESWKVELFTHHFCILFELKMLSLRRTKLNSQCVQNRRRKEYLSTCGIHGKTWDPVQGKCNS